MIHDKISGYAEKAYKKFENPLSGLFDGKSPGLGGTSTNGSTLTFPSTLRNDVNEGKPYVRFSLPPDKGNPQTGQYGADSDVCLFMTNDAGSIADSATTSTTERGKATGLKSFIAMQEVPGEADLLVAGLALTKMILPGAIEPFTDIPGLGLDSRVAFNPMTAVLFESVEIRTFSFNYVFVPESAAESFNITDITNWFRRWLYPKTTGLFSVKYPPLFRVDFMIGDKLNHWYPVYYDSFIKSVDVKMNPLGRANFADGSPTSVGLDITFEESKQLTRNMLYNNDTLYPNMGKDGMRPEYGLPPDSIFRDDVVASGHKGLVAADNFVRGKTG